MSHDLRRAVRLALLAVVGAVLPASAFEAVVPRIAPESVTGAGASRAAVSGAALTGSAVRLGSTASMVPASGVSFTAPVRSVSMNAGLVTGAVNSVAVPTISGAASTVIPVGPVAVGPAPEVAPEKRGAPALDTLNLAAASDRSRGGRQDSGSRFDGRRAPTPAEAVFVVNDEGVQINDRAAVYYQEVRRMVDLYKDSLNLSESLDVMDDAYGDVLAKVSAVEAIAKGRGLSQENTHLEETLVWVDGVLTDGRKKVAVHTHRVFFHHAQNPQSEIREGIRRVDGYINDAEKMFARGGKAEQQLGRVDEVELVFDARGYQEIKDHLRQRGAELNARTGGRISFKFLDEIAPIPKEQSQIREQLNGLVKKYHGAGLSKIIEGVIYSRYVGLLLELKTVEHYHKLGYKILQSGRELFDADGHYISELDVVVQAPDGKVSVVEAKSARVGLPNDEVLQDKVVYKLKTYKKFKAQLDAMIGKKFDAVVFSMDIAIDPDAAQNGRLTDRDMRKLELAEFLRSKEASLSREYGFPVSFLFLQSGPQGGQQQGRGRRR